MGFMVQGCWYEVVGCELEGAIQTSSTGPPHPDASRRQLLSPCYILYETSNKNN